jgi:cyclophilin family peptidyl-prolyl cis-trans isomerase
VVVPALEERDGGAPDVSVELINPTTTQVLETRPTKTGEVDLAALFPRLWTMPEAQVLLAQELVGKERVGAPVVLVPMVPPRATTRVEKDGTPQVPPASGRQQVLSGYWTYTDQRVLMRTSRGEMVFALHPEVAPHSVTNFRDLIAKGFYDGIAFHRLSFLTGRTQPDTVMLGDPTGTGMGNPGYCIDFEPSTMKHTYGTLSYARTPADPNSAGSQVVIVLSREAGAKLDGRYAAFGQLVSGSETLTVIAKTPVDADGKPREAVTIDFAKLVDAPPYGEGPRAEADPAERPVTR